MRFKRAAGACILVLFGAAAACADGEIWVWTTADGEVHYTDQRERVPDAFREKARLAHLESAGSFQRMPGAGAAAAAGEPSAAKRAPAAAAPGAEAEAAWRDQARAIDGKIAALAPQAEACASDHINRMGSHGSRKRREEREEADRCTKAKDDLEAAHSDREALEEKAQRADVPPGWVRPEE